LVAGPTGSSFTQSLLLANRLAQYSEIFHNGEGRSLAIVLDRMKTIVGHLGRQIVFLAVGMADMNLKKRGVVEPRRS